MINLTWGTTTPKGTSKGSSRRDMSLGMMSLGLVYKYNQSMKTRATIHIHSLYFPFYSYHNIFVATDEYCTLRVVISI